MAGIDGGLGETLEVSYREHQASSTQLELSIVAAFFCTSSGEPALEESLKRFKLYLHRYPISNAILYPIYCIYKTLVS